MIYHFMIHLFSIGLGFFGGVFTPAIGREIKSWFVKESTAAVAAAPAPVQAAVAAVSGAVSKL